MNTTRYPHVALLLSFALLGGGCAMLQKEEAPAAPSAQVEAQAALPTEAAVDLMSDEERALALEDFMKTNESEPVDPVKKEQAVTLAEEMDKAPTERSGSFYDVVHEVQGGARLVKSGDGWAVVLSDDFKTEAGPDLHIYVSGSDDPKKSADVHQELSLDLGRLTNVEGGQAYEIGDVDVSKIKSIVVYCKPFKVVFGAAVLK